MDFEEMCLACNMRPKEAKELAECVYAANNDEILFAIHYAQGLKRGKEDAARLERLEKEREQRKRREKNKK